MILVIQRRRKLGHDRARKRVGDLRQRTPWAADRAGLKPMTERKLPARQGTARILRRASLHPRIDQRFAIGVIRRVRTEIHQALLNIVARPISEDVAIGRARPRHKRHEIPRTSRHRRPRRHPQHPSRDNQRHQPAQQRPPTPTATDLTRRPSTSRIITDPAVIVKRDRPRPRTQSRHDPPSHPKTAPANGSTEPSAISPHRQHLRANSGSEATAVELGRARCWFSIQAARASLAAYR